TAVVPLLVQTPQVILSSASANATAALTTANSSGITIQPASGALTYSLGGSATTGTLTLTGGNVTTGSNTGITVNNGITVSVATSGKTLLIGAPQIAVDGSGAASATFQTNGGAITVQPSVGAQTGTLNFALGTTPPTSATLNLNGGAVTTFSSTGTTVNS